VPKTDIVNFLIARLYDFDGKELPYIQVSKSVQKALKRMHQDGYVERFHNPKANLEGLWKLKSREF